MVEKLPPVHYYVMGDTDDPKAPGNFWRAADAWPPKATETPFYFHAGGTLGKAVATGAPNDLVREYAGLEAVEVYGPPARLAEAEAAARGDGLRTRRTGTSVSVLGVERLNGDAPEGERRPTNLEDVFVLLTGEEIA